MQFSITFLAGSILMALAIFGSLTAFFISGILLIAGMLEDPSED